jgi:chitodextrinase
MQLRGRGGLIPTAIQDIRAATSATQLAPAISAAQSGEKVIVTYVEHSSAATTISVSPTTTLHESIFGTGGAHLMAYMGSYTVSGSAVNRTATYDASDPKGVGTQIRVLDSTATVVRAAHVFVSGSWHAVPAKIFRGGQWVEVLLKRTSSADTTAPTAPTGLVSTSTTTTSISLNWTDSTDTIGVTGYKVYRGATLIASPTVSNYVDTGLTASTAYSYSVTALDAAGNESAHSSTLTVSTAAVPADSTAPSAPTGLAVSTKTATSVSLSWTASTDNIAVTGYNVFRGASLVGSPKTANFVDTGLTASTAYTYTVKAFDAAGNVSASSSSLNVTTAASSTGALFGACVANPGGASLSAAQTVQTKFGTKTSIRMYQGATLGLPVHPAGASIVHTSWKPDLASVLNGSLDADIAAIINSTPAGDIIEFYHEPDNDGLDAAGITQMIAVKNYLYDKKQSIKPSVLVAQTFTGGFFANYTAESRRAPWYSIRGDLLGVDTDGIHDATGPTYDTDYADEMAGTKAFMARNAGNGWIGWTVPEIGTSRQPWDATGTARANWFQAQAQKLADGGAYAIMLYDYNTSAHSTATDYNQIKTGTPEFDVWSAFVATNP